MDNTVDNEIVLGNESDTVSMTNIMEKKDAPKEEKNDSTSMLTTETKLSVTNDKPVVNNCETVIATNEPLLVDSIDNNLSVEDELNSAMASAKISPSDTNEIKQIQNESILSEQFTHKFTTIENKNDVVMSNEKSDLFVITSEPNDDMNSTNTSEFLECVDEDSSVEKTLHSDNKECDEKYFSDDKTTLELEKSEEVVTDLPVDIDTNNPQYIPRRGRFYEHDDRMAYSTSSSEGSESGNESDEYNDGNGIETSIKRNTGIKTQDTTTVDLSTENVNNITSDNKSSTKKILAISKANTNTSSGSIRKLSSTKKSRDIDSLDVWTHDLYNELDQTPKTRDELLASYGYDIREESEAPRARRHHKYGRSASTKYTRTWQDTKAYISSESRAKVKHGSWRNDGSNKSKNKSANTNKYTSEFPSLTDDAIPLEQSVNTAIIESSSIEKDNDPLKSLSTDIQIIDIANKPKVDDSSQYNASSSKISGKFDTSSNRNSQNTGNLASHNNKNFFKRSSNNYSANKEKIAQNNRDVPTTTNSNFYKRPQFNDNQNVNFKPHFSNIHKTSRVHNQNHQNSVINRSQQYNRDRYFSKRTVPSSNSNQHNMVNTTAGTGRTQHSGEHYNHENQQINTIVQPPVVRSSKRYSVQSNRALPNPVLNFGGMNKTSQSQIQPPQIQPPQIQPSQIQPPQIQPPQIQPSQIQPAQLQPPQLQSAMPPPMQYHQMHQQMVLDHNGLMVNCDPAIYHHQLYSTPQYTNTISPCSAAGNVEDPNVAMQILAAQSAVYRPVPSGTSPTSAIQPDSFMTTFYQPQQPTQTPPRRVNLAIPIVTPPPEQAVPKSVPSQKTMSTN